MLPVTTFDAVMRGHPIDFILYANNYEQVDEAHPILERLASPAQALEVFRQGTTMSKGTTTSSGLVQSYFANIFGSHQYEALRDEIARRYFEAFYRRDLFIGQLRTRLDISGWEMRGPEEAAMTLLNLFSVERNISRA